MTDLVKALEDRISALEDEKEELEDSLCRIEDKLDAYRELLSEELGESEEKSPPPAAKKKPGRPKGSKNRKTATKSTPRKKQKTSVHAVEDSIWEEAQRSLPSGAAPTTAEEQERARARFSPAPRPQPHYGVRAGDPKDVLGPNNSPKTKGNASITIEDD